MLQADLHRLHLLQELVQGCHVHLRLDVDLFLHFLELRQIRVHEASAAHIFIVL